MGLGIFNRNRKSLIVPPVPSAQPLELRVLVDAGPAARDAFTISVPAEGTVDSIREAAAAHIGRTGIALFKRPGPGAAIVAVGQHSWIAGSLSEPRGIPFVRGTGTVVLTVQAVLRSLNLTVSIPWQAQYQASAYAESYGVVPSLLTQFPAYNLDDATQMHASGGLPLPAYRNGSGSLRLKRSSYYKGPAPTVAQWFPHIEEGTINILARSRETLSAIDWVQPRVPLTLCARFSGKGERAQLVIVDVDQDASIRDLKIALLRAAGRPTHAHLMEGLTLWRVDMTEAELSAIDARGGLTGGQRPRPCASFSTPLLMADCVGARVGEFFSPGVNVSRANPAQVSISVYVHQGAEYELAPVVPAPKFTYPMPTALQAPKRSLGPLAASQPACIETEAGEPVAVQVCLDSPSPTPSTSSEGSGDTVLPHAPLRCCAGMGTIGLGIFMSPVPSCESDHTSCSEDEECASWPPTPVVSEESYGWSKTDSWKHDFAFTSSAFPSSQPASYASFSKFNSRRPQLQNLFVPPTPQL
ncbi:hypothetical protein A1Q1_07529 [Trichosporon asahii var. asahii CBS 2479]|uniref:Uncharacterized protein n=1 Tax=Trichosporon asahii var. asahii (strain ATCC 90039 / CBS 2479 / JCM 2466 / KCTC 7840 / NBRC 103889/ NCYC 2677 / UAMH 7654) TaxID=1186058 RepID=J5TJQ5_TRIAS|nr:hypothetical protein A1Q1_07529 [Trichosporon asahii var. asahii CBS 2479]EJT51251.1 hypothetical protein A1Q1_07529 [Trichosporon asahii var. asahii CBS 2479]